MCFTQLKTAFSASCRCHVTNKRTPSYPYVNRALCISRRSFPGSEDLCGGGQTPSHPEHIKADLATATGSLAVFNTLATCKL